MLPRRCSYIVGNRATALHRLDAWPQRVVACRSAWQRASRRPAHSAGAVLTTLRHSLAHRIPGACSGSERCSALLLSWRRRARRARRGATALARSMTAGRAPSNLAPQCMGGGPHRHGRASWPTVCSIRAAQRWRQRRTRKFGGVCRGGLLGDGCCWPLDWPQEAEARCACA